VDPRKKDQRAKKNYVPTTAAVKKKIFLGGVE
jgi:hypothetical protein